jgi:hypothetical protein
MKRIGTSKAWLVVGMVAAALMAGCHKSNSASGKSGSLTSGKASPEESFKIILATFKRGIEDVQAGFVLPESAGSGHSMLATQNKVTSELIPPANEAEPYRATITVTNRSRFSLQRNEAEEKERKDEKNQQESSSSTTDATGADNGVQILDPDLVSSSSTSKGKKGPSITDSAVSRQTIESQRTYELVYENGRWNLVTKLDEELEKSIQGAFDQALGTQP